MNNPLSDILKKFIPEQAEWKLSLLNNWETIIGDLSAHVRLQKIHNDTTLVLGVYDSSWLHELYFLTPLLIKKINSKLDKPRIKNLKFVQTVKDKKKSIKKFTPPAPPTFPEVTLSQKQAKALTNITDEELKQALKKFLNRCHHE